MKDEEIAFTVGKNYLNQSVTIWTFEATYWLRKLKIRVFFVLQLVISKKKTRENIFLTKLPYSMELPMNAKNVTNSA